MAVKTAKKRKDGKQEVTKKTPVWQELPVDESKRTWSDEESYNIIPTTITTTTTTMAANIHSSRNQNLYTKLSTFCVSYYL